MFDPNEEEGKSLKPEKGSLKKTVYKKTGGKQILFLSICPGVPESYENIQTILDKIKLYLLEDFKVVGDLKVYNLVCGIGTHSSKFPCPFCLTYRDKNGFWVQAEQRTWQNIIANNAEWIKNGGKEKDLMKYFNCAHPPMIGPGTDEPVMWTMPPPSLHLYLSVNHILKSLLSHWEYLVSWLHEVLHVVFAPYHGKTLEGNDVFKVLSNLDRMKEAVPAEFSSYVHCLACFRYIHEVNIQE